METLMKDAIYGPRTSEDDFLPLVLFQTSRGRIINLLMIESMQVPSPTNPRQPYGCYMVSGIFHTLDEEEFDLIVSQYAEIASHRPILRPESIK